MFLSSLVRGREEGVHHEVTGVRDKTDPKESSGEHKTLIYL